MIFHKSVQKSVQKDGTKKRTRKLENGKSKNSNLGGKIHNQRLEKAKRCRL